MTTKEKEISNFTKFWQRVKAYIDNLFGITFKQVVLDELPEVGEFKTVYFIPSSNPSSENTYDEFLWVAASGDDPTDEGYIPAHFEQVGSTAYVPDHTIDTTSLAGKVVITKDARSFAVDAEEIVKPATPTLTTGGTFTNSKSVEAACATSGAIIRYTMTDDNTTPADPTDSSTAYTGAITLEQDTSVKTKVYKIKVAAFKNGLVSDVATATYNINRQVATPTLAASGNDYATTRTITLACTTTGATIKYRFSAIGEWQTYSTPFTISSTSQIFVEASLNLWESNSIKQTVTVGKNKCYIGQAASLADDAAIKALSNSYERETLVGYTAPEIDFGTTTEYVWFCIPNTESRNLTVKSGGYGVTLNDVAGSVVGSYRVWRTANKINNKFTFEIS